jgi:hypothetical protein
MTEHYDVSPEDQAEFLATRWVSVKQLEEAGERWTALPASVIDYGFSGIPCRKGPFTKQEVGKIQAALDVYQKVRHLMNRYLLYPLIYWSLV